MKYLVVFFVVLLAVTLTLAANSGAGGEAGASAGMSVGGGVGAGAGGSGGGGASIVKRSTSDDAEAKGEGTASEAKESSQKRVFKRSPGGGDDPQTEEPPKQ